MPKTIRGKHFISILFALSFFSVRKISLETELLDALNFKDTSPRTTNNTMTGENKAPVGESIENLTFTDTKSIYTDGASDMAETSSFSVMDKSLNWAEDYSCFKPMESPILGTHDMSRILNMGFPKCGSSSISRLFHSSGFYERHFHCGKQGYCGRCMAKWLLENETILENCGNYTVWSQMDYSSFSGKCVYPQVHYLNALYNDAPDATWLLPFRNVTSWIGSITRWKNIRTRISNYCDFKRLGFQRQKKNPDEDFVRLYCNHVKHIRDFVKEHPSLSLVEFSIEDPYAGEYLAGIFPGVNATFWGQANNYEEVAPLLEKRHAARLARLEKRQKMRQKKREEEPTNK